VNSFESSRFCVPSLSYHEISTEIPIFESLLWPWIGRKEKKKTCHDSIENHGRIGSNISKDYLLYIQYSFCCLMILHASRYIVIQVSLTIRGGYVPGKFSTANTKTPVLSLKRLNFAKNGSFPLLFTVFKSMNSQNRKYQTRK